MTAREGFGRRPAAHVSFRFMLLMFVSMGLVFAVMATSSSWGTSSGTAHALESSLSLDDDEMRDRLLELMDRRMREFRAEMAKQLDEMLKLRGESGRMADRLAQLEEENARLKRTVRELRGESAGGRNADEVEPGQAAGPAVAFLGVSTVPANDELARRVKADPASCLEVVSVLEKTPAAAVGLRTGDVITRIGGMPASRENFQSVLGSKKIGDSLQLTYFQTSGASPIQIDAKTKMANRQDFSEAIAKLMARQRGEQPEAAEATPSDAPARLGMTVEEVAAGNIKVLEVSENSNAAAAGLRSGDQLTHLGETKLSSLDDIRAVVGNWRVGQRGRFVYLRGDARHAAVVSLGGAGQEPRVVSMETSEESHAKGGKVSFGVSVEEPENARGGLHVLEVFGGSNAAEAGIQVGDRLVNVDGNRIRSLDDLREALSSWSAGQEASIRYRRERTTFNAKIVLAGEGGRPRLVSLEEGRRGGQGSSRPERGGQRRPGFLGVRLAEADGGMRIGEVIDGSSAAAMGLQAGDILTAINGKKIQGQSDLRDALGSLSAGDSISIEVRRGQDTKEMKGTLGARPESAQAPTTSALATTSAKAAPVTATATSARVSRAPSASRPSLGLVAAEDGENVVVDSLLPGSVLASAGIQPGDRLVDLGGHSIDGFSAVREALSGVEAGGTVTLIVERDGNQLATSVRLGGPQPVASGRPLIGFELEEVLDSGRVRVISVAPGGPAAKAGLRAGDRVVGFDGTTSVGLDAIRDVLGRRRAGDVVTVQVERNGLLTDLRVTLGSRD